MISRRGFLTGLSTGTMVSLLAGRNTVFATDPQTAQDSTYFHWSTIADDVRVAFGGGGASLVYSSGGESILIDCKGYGLGTRLRREVEEGGNRLVCAANTHHHSDQTGGNVAFTSDLPVVAHERAGRRIVSSVRGVLEAVREDPEGVIGRRRGAIREMAHSELGADLAMGEFYELAARIDEITPESFGPTATFSDVHTIEVGGQEVEFLHLGAGHTDNDIVVEIAAANVMHVGNLVHLESHPVIDARGGADTASWRRSLETLLEVTEAATMVVTSDGPFSYRDALQNQIDYFDQLHDLVSNAIQAGMEREELVQFIPSTGLGRFSGLANSNRLEINLGIVYDEMVG